MVFEQFTEVSTQLGLPIWAIAVAFSIYVIWEIVWKGLALWKSARNRSPIWFIVILLTNTLGILPILYIFLFSKIKLDGKKGKKTKGKRKK